MNVLYSDADWLVINKPTGISTHGAFPGDLAAQEWLALHRGQETFVCSRLDKGTSGVLLFARTKEASGRAQRIHESGRAVKEYVLLSRSAPRTGTFVCRKALDGLPCETEFTFEGGHPSRGFAYRARITRGRTHQIRRHAAAEGIAILGDDEYGGAAFPRLALHCEKLFWPGIEAPGGGPIMATLPPSFASVMNTSPSASSTAASLALSADYLVAFDRRLRFFEGVTDAYRVIHRGEIPSLDLAVDAYGQWLCVWSYDEHTATDQLFRSLEPLLADLLARTGCAGGVLKRSSRDPHNRRLVSESRVFGKPPPPSYVVSEHGLRYLVTLTEKQHVGLFLDQRDNRKRILALSAGARVANLFSFTCSVSVAAAAGGAEVVFSVDAAKSVLDTGKENFALNGLVDGEGGGRGKFIAEDAVAWLDRQLRKRERDPQAPALDLVFCDPPTFSTTDRKKSGRTEGVFSVERAWSHLVDSTRELLAESGQAFFSNNHQTRDDDFYARALERAFSRVERLSAPLDFPELPSRAPHVRLFLCRP